VQRRFEPELPGDVLVALRESEGFSSAREFASTLAMSRYTLWRLEKVRWGMPPETWDRPVDRNDLEALVTGGWVTEGDAWWQRFRTAFAWQHVVRKYGRQIFDDGESSVSLLEPVSQEHVLALVEATARREVTARAGRMGVSCDEKLQALVDRVYAEIVFRLSSMGYIMTRDSGGITPEGEATRALVGLLGSGSEIRTSYGRTLLLVYEWSENEVRRVLADSTGDQAVSRGEEHD